MGPLPVVPLTAHPPEVSHLGKGGHDQALGMTNG